ncbi:DnaJ domain-containing protein [Craurococcus roseus]|uniref:DnaJ domain-containing protein n=1 Tax=Craurococcus roseus TaxID=77585 RepID=A0ABP3QSA8_9PROT
MVWVALGAGALLFGVWLLRLLANAPASAIRQGLVWFAGLLAAAVVLLMLFTGRAPQLVGLAGLLAPFAYRWWHNRRAARRFGAGAAGGESGGGESRVETTTLEMRLDHASGRMSGRVRVGPQAGRELAELSRTELLALLAACRTGDPDSVPLLEAWLDRADPHWREDDGHGGGAEGARTAAPGSGPMTRQEALAVLGLAEGASEAEIKAAHRRLMRAAHPDSGGSDWMAARLNEARDVLMP